MDGITATRTSDGIHWTLFQHRKWDHDVGFRMNFSFNGHHSLRDSVRTAKSFLETDSVSWLREIGGTWQFDVEEFRRWMNEMGDDCKTFLERIDWLTGSINVSPELDHFIQKNTGKPRSHLRFNIYKEEYEMNSTRRIFLSHKGADKPMVERFHKTLDLLGFDPWLDKDAMPSGTELHRGLKKGFQDSCAVVFFITPSFKDESYLRNEINYAVEEKTAKGDRFAIITLVFADERGKRGVVPDLLRSYVWNEPSDELEALQEMIRALPIEVGLPAWRAGLS